MQKGILVILGVLLTAAMAQGADIRVFSGAGLIKPMEEMRGLFERRNTLAVEVHYASSGELFGMLAAGQPCDVLIPGAAKYTQDAHRNGWVLEETVHNLVLHKPVIAVPAGNPARIKGLADLGRDGVRLAIGDPRAPAIGRVAKKMLTRAGLWDAAQSNIKVYAPTVNQLLVYVTLQQVDAAIIWEDLTRWSEGQGRLETVQIDARQNIIKTIPTAVCSRTRNKAAAMAFNRYVASPEGMAIWQKWGFVPCGQ